MIFSKKQAFRQANFVLTSIGVRNKGFYTPYDYLSSVAEEEKPYPCIQKLFQKQHSAFVSFMDIMAAQQEYFRQSAQGSPCPNWDSIFLSPLDAAAIYTGMPAFRPGRVVEVGSGNSTMFMARAVADHRLPTRITCIDPKPRIDISGLDVQFERRTLSCGDVEMFAGFDAGDILFIDSSHIMQQNFDVDILFNRIFPVLKPGVIVHVHDIFLPYGYPKSWRDYHFNEQNALVGWLVSGYFDVLFPCQYVFRDMHAELKQRMNVFPDVASRDGGSIWLRRSDIPAAA